MHRKENDPLVFGRIRVLTLQSYYGIGQVEGIMFQRDSYSATACIMTDIEQKKKGLTNLCVFIKLITTKNSKLFYVLKHENFFLIHLDLI